MNIINIEKQYNKDLDSLKNKIELLRSSLNDYNKIISTSIKCNVDYRIPSKLEKHTNNSDEIMCPKKTPICAKSEGDNGICVNNNLEKIENEILTLNNEIINSFIKLNIDYKKYKNSPEMIKISKEIMLLNTIQEIEVEKQVLKLEEAQDISNNFGSRDNIFTSENRYYSYLLLLIILITYSVYSFYKGENYNNVDYTIIILILLFVAYIAYITFYK